MARTLFLVGRCSPRSVAVTCPNPECGESLTVSLQSAAPYAGVGADEIATHDCRCPQTAEWLAAVDDAAQQAAWEAQVRQ